MAMISGIVFCEEYLLSQNSLSWLWYEFFVSRIFISRKYLQTSLSAGCDVDRSFFIAKNSLADIPI
jgi:hypothetical protein